MRPVFFLESLLMMSVLLINSSSTAYICSHIQRTKPIITKSSVVACPEQFEETLQNNVIAENLVVVITVNHGMLPFFINFVYFLRRSSISKFIVVTEDARSHAALEPSYFRHLSRYNTALNDTRSASYKTKAYNTMVSRRPALIRYVLERGYNVLYSDVDVVWAKNPLPHLSCGQNYDIAAQLDEGRLCTGFTLFCNSELTYALTALWEARMRRSPDLNQKGFNSIAKSSGATCKRLDSLLFQSGREYFDRGSNRSEAITIHNNFIIGSDKKMRRFKDHGLWFSNASL